MLSLVAVYDLGNVLEDLGFDDSYIRALIKDLEQKSQLEKVKSGETVILLVPELRSVEEVVDIPTILEIDHDFGEPEYEYGIE